MEKEQDKKNNPIKEDGKKGQRITFFSFIGGDFLLMPFFTRQLKMILLIILYFILSISNRFSGQQELLMIPKLKDSLEEVRYAALTRASELMVLSKQSNVQRYLKEHHSELKVADQSPIELKKEK